MALKLRVENSGAIYHVQNRGDLPEPNVPTDSALFLETPGEN